ncbi:hypothetical protein EK21DRAFT_68085 [Setomelanomma holmii]|uniref:Ams2/SPT21 N-terminal domain-containing protein n=1 Tax=Setomelanomma holmii TaxID=210430 RepID=A0A9P4LLH3_9PLEO|nr:hypothetical protein EK21DRAFT_68085 [Setomelanomma holmii]
MSTPSYVAIEGAIQQTSASSADDDNISDIPRRSMRGKHVLYTFDDQNKSNCLARLPNALSVPVVSLDENTQVGVIELKTCVQAIVAASPELVAKLGHDYTVYAYDFSEYETPLVGQGMLSWILASASSTPNAPADESQTMVTGRVCKNILGLFGNGMKETLEVKLKLVPVPTSLQKEYVENMERYHSLSQLMPEGFDYNAWSDFLKENPTLGELAQPTPIMPTAQPSQRSSLGGYEPFHQMLTRNSPSREPLRADSFYDQANMSFDTQQTRASSPAMSTLSFHHYQYNTDSRPASRASVRNDVVQPHQHQHFTPQDQYIIEQQEEGPPKKRAKIVQTKRPKKTPLTAHNDSLRVTASTAAPRRLPAPSALRHASMDEGRPYMSPYNNSTFSDNAVDSGDDERGASPGDTPMDIPSSPPLAPQRTASPDPSSPSLPTLLLPHDSGFVSDMPLGLDEEGIDLGSNIWDGSDLPVAPEARVRKRQDRSGNPWQQVNPGPVDLLPQSYVPRPKQHYRKPESQPVTQSIEQQPGPAVSKATSPEAAFSHVSPESDYDPQAYSRSATPNLPAQKPKASRGKGLSRSQTWSGAGEPMSDAPAPSEAGVPRSGSGARRKKYIKDKMEKAIAAGELPPHCKNCGEIDTPTWRKAYTRVEYGSPEGIEISRDTAGTGIIAVEAIGLMEDSNGASSYRIFKNNVTREEKDANLFEELYLCNPCGLWFIKKGSMRPQKLWDKSEKATKRKRQAAARTKSVSQESDFTSDAVVPHSEPVVPEENEVSAASFDGATDNIMLPPPLLHRDSSFQSVNQPSNLDKDTAEEALRRAIQSSPAGLRGSKHSPINVEPDLTPKPTRRLLFPSPRKNGEAKSLSPMTAEPLAAVDDANKDTVPEKPRCQRCKRLRKGCDRERPCGRCDNADIGFEGCVPCEMPRTNWFETPVVNMASLDEENPDKENCPPPAEEHDDFAHLFEDPVSPKTTPKKDQLFQDLLKTPTPGSRRRNPLTPRQAAIIAPETPFTRQLNAMLSDCNYSSPSRIIDFSAFPTFNTPGRTQFSEFMHDDFLSSDMPMPSSPPKSGALGLGFEMYEDPETATAGLWSGVNMFGNDAMMADFQDPKPNIAELNGGMEKATLLKMNVGGITVDFAAMIEEVVSNNNEDAQEQESEVSRETESQGLGRTPDVPTAE